MEKVAIICSGGGMRSAHGAGFLYAMARRLEIKNPHIMIGSSGDAGNIAYFCAGQYESMRRIWTELLSTPKFISFLRPWRVMNIDYLIDEVFKKQEPLNVSALKQSAIEWHIPITRFDTGKLRYVENSDSVDIFETLRATTALPIFFRKKIAIQGGTYVDGELGPILQDHVSEALARGATKLLILNHTHPWGVISKAIMRAYAAHAPEGMREAVIRDISTDVYEMRAPGASALIVAPRNLSAGSLTRNKGKLLATFEQGLGDALALEKELRTLFSTA